MKNIVFLIIALWFTQCCTKDDPEPSLKCNISFQEVDGECVCIEGVAYGEYNCIDSEQKYYQGSFDCACETEVLLTIYPSGSSADMYAAKIVFRDSIGLYGAEGSPLVHLGWDEYKGIASEYICKLDGYRCYGEYIVQYPILDDTLRGTIIMQSIEDRPGAVDPVRECNFAFPLYNP